MLHKRGILGNFAKFTGKHRPRVSFLRPVTSLKKKLWRKCFPENFSTNTVSYKTPPVTTSTSSQPK